MSFVAITLRKKKRCGPLQLIAPTVCQHHDAHGGACFMLFPHDFHYNVSILLGASLCLFISSSLELYIVACGIVDSSRILSSRWFLFGQRLQSREGHGWSGKKQQGAHVARSDDVHFEFYE